MKIQTESTAVAALVKLRTECLTADAFARYMLSLLKLMIMKILGLKLPFYYSHFILTQHACIY